MVQLIDPPHVTRIVDYTTLFASKAWTGRILIRADAWYERPLVVAGLCAGLACLGAGLWTWRRGRRARAAA